MLDIMERMIGNRCTLQYIVTDQQIPRHIELWARTRAPGKIPKKV
jgi:hypothetical protein